MATGSANGRFARKVFQEMTERHTRRIADRFNGTAGEVTAEQLITLTPADLPMPMRQSPIEPAASMPDPAAEQMCAYSTLMETSSLLQHAVEQQLRRDAGLTYIQFQILAALDTAPGGQMRPTDIAERLVYSLSAMSYQNTQLVNANLITRTPSTEDQRSTTLTLTDKGKALLRRVRPGHIEMVRRTLLDILDGQETATLASLLGRVRDQLRTAPPCGVRKLRQRR